MKKASIGEKRIKREKGLRRKKDYENKGIQSKRYIGEKYE